jgi:ADP-ribose pyrophosphatase
MRSIIIVAGLGKDYLSTEQPFAASRNNIGQAEIDRLLGRGKARGHGPLAAFLKAVSSGVESSSRLQLVCLAEESPVPEVLEPWLGSAQMLESSRDGIPWRGLAEVMGSVDPEDDEIRCFVLGCHTEQRVLSVASYLRTMLGFEEVAVSPHLSGSSTQEAHFASLRHTFPGLGVKVLLDPREIAEYTGLPEESLAHLPCGPPEIGPEETRTNLQDEQLRILERLCMNWSRAEVKPLAGGYSGSLLLLANGWKGKSRTEPLVLKVDEFSQMRRELAGYHQVKDFFGKHVPTFGYPVSEQGSIGVGMELAAMEGRPRTLQANFEDVETDEQLAGFLRQLDKALDLLSQKLYRNTEEPSWIAPYRAFGIHTEKQVTYLARNAQTIISYFEGEFAADGMVDPDQVTKLMKLVGRNPDGVDGRVCLVHGDLNYANIICDEADNVWFIDWTHCGHLPIELDFAKLESDAKFVMSKAFDNSDLPRLRLLEEYFVEHDIPAEANSLPDRLKFAKWDLRFRKVLETVRRIRLACSALTDTDDDLVYRIALLRYATHTLSFDQRRGQGECAPPQLMHALYSVEALLHSLVADDFHLKIRSERPASYPARQRISIDESPWMLDCPDYAPPYHVDPAVLEHDRSAHAGGWADPEEFSSIRDDDRFAAVKYRSDLGVPRNPRGRTGIEGRGLLGLWGPNLSVVPVILRSNPHTEGVELLLPSRGESPMPELPKGFVLPGEDPVATVHRVVEAETGWEIEGLDPRQISEGYTYDPRQTDNAWVVSRVFMVPGDKAPPLFRAGADFDEVKWWPLDANTLNQLPSDHSRFVREVLPHVVEAGQMASAQVDQLLASTG